MRGLLVLAIAWFCMPLGGLSAQATEDVLDVYEAGLRNDPRINAARYDYKAALQKIPQARAELLPQLSFDARRSRTDQNVIDRAQPLFGVGRSDFTTDSWQVQASQPLFRYSSWVQLGQARAVVRQAFAVHAAAEQELILRAAALYLNVLASRDRVTLADAELAAVGRQRDLVKAQRRGGLAGVTEEYEADARYAVVEADLIEASYALDDAYQALREMVGDAVSALYPLREQIPLVMPEPANLEEWVSRSIEQNLLLRARTEAVAVAQQETRRVRAAHYPTLELVASTGNTDVGGAVTGGASNTDTQVVGLQFSMPIYSGGMVASRTEEADMVLRRVQEERLLQHRTVMRETRAAYQGVSSAIQRVRALEASLASQRSAVDGKTRGFQSGVYTLLDVLDSQRDLYSTLRDLARARYEYLLNLLQLKRLAGSLGEDDLRHLNQLMDRSQSVSLAGNI